MLGSWVTGSSDFAASVWRSSTSLLMIGWCHVFYPNGSPQQMIKAFNGTWYSTGWGKSFGRFLRQCSKRCGPSMQGAWRSWPRLASERDDACNTEKNLQNMLFARRMMFMRIEFYFWRTGRMWMVCAVNFSVFFHVTDETATAGNCNDVSCQPYMLSRFTMVNLAKSCQVNLPTTAVLHGDSKSGFIQAADGREGQYITHVWYRNCFWSLIYFDIVYIRWSVADMYRYVF